MDLSKFEASGLDSEFQASQGFILRHCLKAAAVTGRDRVLCCFVSMFGSLVLAVLPERSDLLGKAVLSLPTSSFLLQLNMTLT